MARAFNMTVELAPLAPVGGHGLNSTLSSVLTLTPPVGAGRILLQALSASIRYTLDGSNPSSGSRGFILRQDDPPTMLVITPGMTLKVIQDTAGAVLQYQWGE